MDNKKFDKMQFAQLIDNNPELPVLIVEAKNTIGDAIPAKVYIGKYFKGEMGNYIYSNSFKKMVKVILFECEEADIEDADYETVKDLYENLEWKEAIIVEPEEDKKSSIEQLIMKQIEKKIKSEI